MDAGSQHVAHENVYTMSGGLPMARISSLDFLDAYPHPMASKSMPS
jgi:hypothetical protein